MRPAEARRHTDVLHLVSKCINRRAGIDARIGCPKKVTMPITQKVLLDGRVLIGSRPTVHYAQL